ncbi:hypothetical protein [Pseudodesulfovibrio profundus]|uniref:hypothetical protein n=1 Tax=Pseudodesulfovibrio profundus TaxID=57320 RepID=UPI0012FFCA66|nr:hypothetical protein [Pseudodesulfovibrio profundus]
MHTVYALDIEDILKPRSEEQIDHNQKDARHLSTSAPQTSQPEKRFEPLLPATVARL